MRDAQFIAVCGKLKLKESDISTVSLQNLTNISVAAQYAIHYRYSKFVRKSVKILSDLAIHTPKACEVELSWETIFQRIVMENRPGVCYERGEVLYQTLKHLGRIFYFFKHFLSFDSKSL